MYVKIHTSNFLRLQTDFEKFALDRKVLQPSPVSPTQIAYLFRLFIDEYENTPNVILLRNFKKSTI